MSYILEALKKAQAERQLGSAPTIHAPQPVPASEPESAASRRPLLIGLGAGALVVAAGAAFLWRAGPAPAPAVPAAASHPAAPAAQAPSAPDTLEVSAPPPAPAARVAEARPAPARAPAPAAKAAAVPAPAPAAALAALPAPAPAPAAAPGRAPAQPPATAAAEDSLPFLQQLPDAVQREVPRVSLGGYMYSANPADRLLLVDKALRHEGEEVAPGLVLEKLLPKAAVMNYRGTRYRVAY
jgi:general secretion pathway protein B